MTANAYAVIMAGGSGKRFWPLSRRTHPKQLLPFGDGTESLLQATVNRIAKIIPKERVIIVTSENLADAIAHQVPQVLPEHVLREPVGRNTAPCVGWAASHVKRIDPNGVLAVLPADHFIGDEESYLDVVERSLAAAADGALVTVGIRPNRPETGYGYVEVGELVSTGVHRARRFVEKPNRQRAEQFLAAGNFLWNSGMFFFRATAILDAIQRHLPTLGNALSSYEAATNEDEEDALVRSTYGALPSVSIDHGVMEKAADVRVVPGSFGWSDLGSWTTAWDLASKDENGNALPAEAVALESERCFVRAPRGKRVALIGVKDLVVVDTEDALLIVPRDRAQDVKRIVEHYEEQGDDSLL